MFFCVFAWVFDDLYRLQATNSFNELLGDDRWRHRMEVTTPKKDTGKFLGKKPMAGDFNSKMIGGTHDDDLGKLHIK